MSSPYIQSSVHLTRNQKDFLRNNFINLSRLTRASVNQLMNKREGQIFKVRPSQAPSEELTNG